MFGSPETQPGGRALKFYASQRLDVRRISTEGTAGEQTHNRVKVTVKKNKMAPPFRIAEFDVIFGRGISQAGCVADLALQRRLISKSGSWFDLSDYGYGTIQGRPKVVELLERDADLMANLYGRIISA
jgi:recombination protein RecA